MYGKIMVPVDLSHVDRLTRAIDVATDLARHWDAELVFVGVTAETPGEVAHNAKEFAAKLSDFAAGHSEGHTVRTSAHTVVSNDPAADLDAHLLRAIDDVGAEAVVMQTHMPGIADRLWPSHGGQLAGRSRASVFLIRSG